MLPNLRLNRLFSLFVVFSLTLLIPSSSFCSDRKDVIKFLDITGIKDGLSRSLEIYVDLMKKQYPKAPAQFWKKDIATDLDDMRSRLMKKYIELYSRHFTEAEMNEVIKFYESPPGKKFSELNIKLLPELQRFAAESNDDLNKKIMKKLEANDYK